MSLTDINQQIDKFILDNVKETEIMKCIQYAMAGGKKIRSIIYLTVLDNLLQSSPTVSSPSTSNDIKKILRSGFLYPELIHSASLILDDMPHMDDDSLRRNGPSVHIKFGKGCAQLSAFIMIQLAQQHLAQIVIDLHQLGYTTLEQYAKLQLFLHQTKCDFLGEDGLAGGQFMDLFGMDGGGLERYLKMAGLKTSRLFEDRKSVV